MANNARGMRCAECGISFFPDGKAARTHCYECKPVPRVTAPTAAVVSAVVSAVVPAVVPAAVGTVARAVHQAQKSRLIESIESELDDAGLAGSVDAIILLDAAANLQRMAAEGTGTQFRASMEAYLEQHRRVFTAEAAPSSSALADIFGE